MKIQPNYALNNYNFFNQATFVFGCQTSPFYSFVPLNPEFVFQYYYNSYPPEKRE